jgi:hypothetical protein
MVGQQRPQWQNQELISDSKIFGLNMFSYEKTIKISFSEFYFAFSVYKLLGNTFLHTVVFSIFLSMCLSDPSSGGKYCIFHIQCRLDRLILWDSEVDKFESKNSEKVRSLPSKDFSGC